VGNSHNCVIGFGGGGFVILNEDFVRRSVADISGLLREIGWGRAGWDDVSHLLSEVLPGSSTSIINYDMQNTVVRRAFVYGVDQTYLETYQAHYVNLNPWMPYWETLASGQIGVSERDSPARAFKDTEFYTDWLEPQETMESVVGMRLDLDPQNTIYVAWHYAVQSSYGYDAAAEAILYGSRSALREATQGALTLGGRVEGGVRLGTLLERIDGGAVLVTRNRTIREANARMEVGLADGTIISSVNNRLVIKDAAAQRWLDDAIARILTLKAGDASTTFVIGDQVFSATVTPAPEFDAGNFALLVAPPPQVLVVFRRLAGGEVSLDTVSLRLAYGLSTAETRLCEIMLNGRSIAEAAVILGITEGTVRQRVKDIFQKTRTHRQGELIARLAGFTITGWPICRPDKTPIWE
jgi:DNA-binding CsgD family transcriptional regulator